MRKFFVIAAALAATGAGVAAAARQQPGPLRHTQQWTEALPGEPADLVAGAMDDVVMELADEQGPLTRKLAIMPGRGVELGVTVRDLDTSN
jgi:hypothetical protein